MALIHDILETRGRQGALLSGLDRREIEAATQYMADEDAGVGFLYSGWCQAALPHRRLESDSAGWQITGERITLIVEPGMKPGPNGEPLHVGVPFGSRARLILIYLQSEAIRTGCREIELGKSLNAWLKRLEIPVGGKSFAQVREQAERLSRCKLTFHFKTRKGTGMVSQTVVDKALFLNMDDSPQGSLFVERACLSEEFFRELKNHPVPMEEAAIKALNNNSMALDIYAWLAYRLHALTGPVTVHWRALMPQFGKAFSRVDHFKVRFTESLNLALAVYPAARVEVSPSGLTLNPSSPPVPKPRRVA
jgi:hypothetical protein